MIAPAYFASVQAQTSALWDKLEADKVLAAPWFQLFKQVQSPRHVLSELLQNADDAGASEASVQVEDGAFVFSHDGEDFTAEQFASICRFGHSNKRALHTIGFRGIGFKSTFSLGPIVELTTPSLSLHFKSTRFTEPFWDARPLRSDGRTQVRVQIADQFRRLDLQKNLDEWLKSPVSLLFFRTLRTLIIGKQTIRWEPVEPGPVQGSVWMSQATEPDRRLLVVRSESEPFPPAALDEIRQERMVGSDHDQDFPPCRVELVLGSESRLYVVLPTGVSPNLPFACNAPFIQDPARIKIKDPAISETNRWLLERLGTLAATTLRQWVALERLPLKYRSQAYDLMPDTDVVDDSIESSCYARVAEGFSQALSGASFLLSHRGELQAAKTCVTYPAQLNAVWPQEVVLSLVDGSGRAALANEVSASNRNKLSRLGHVHDFKRGDVITALQLKRMSVPESWGHLAVLWAWLAPDITSYRRTFVPQSLNIVPVAGESQLSTGRQVHRMPDALALLRNEDALFVSRFAKGLAVDWSEYLNHRPCDAEKGASAAEAAHTAFGLLPALGLAVATEPASLVDQVARALFQQPSVSRSDCVRLAHIAARLGVQVGESFQFVTEGGGCRRASDQLVAEGDASLGDLLAPSERGSVVIHADYTEAFHACSRDEWNRWISLGRSGLRTGVPIVSVSRNIRNRAEVEAEVRKRGGTGVLDFAAYKGELFEIRDWDFSQAQWLHWERQAEGDPKVWARLAAHVLRQPQVHWSSACAAQALHVSRTASRALTSEHLLPAWLLRLRGLPCLFDTRGAIRQPAELLRRTAQTEALIDVEPFIDRALDSSATTELLDLLGVRYSPSGPDRFLDRLRALSLAGNVPGHEVDKWYVRLDQVFDNATTEDAARIRGAFGNERLILSEAGAWVDAKSVFLLAEEEDVPGAALIRPTVRDLSLWQKVRVAERPTLDLALAWLRGLPEGKSLPADDLRRARALQSRHALRVWRECQHWLNLLGEWVPVGTVAYTLSMQSLVAWTHLHEVVKRKTADMQRLPAEALSSPEIAMIPSLASCISDRFHRPVVADHTSQVKPWVVALGKALSRIMLDDDSAIAKARSLGARLLHTRWQEVPGIEIVPYIDGVPAGLPRRTSALWDDSTMYVVPGPMTRLAAPVTAELDRAFERRDIADAIKLCFERDANFVDEYMESAFSLAEPSEARTETVAPAPTRFVQDIAGDGADGGVDAKVGASGGQSPGGAATSIEAETGAGTGIESETGAGTCIQDDKDEVDANEPDSILTHEALGFEEIDEGGDEPTPLTRAKPQPKPPVVPLIERFAHLQNFKRVGPRQFERSDGTQIVRTQDGLFPWVRRSGLGEDQRYYLPIDESLQVGPVEVEAAAWAALEGRPDAYSLLLRDRDGGPVETSGTALRGWLSEGALQVFAASYRVSLRPAQDRQGLPAGASDPHAPSGNAL